MSSDKRCTALNAAGVQCGAARLHGSDRCRVHDPDARAEHLDACRKGGSNRKVRGPAIGDLIALDALDLTAPGDIARLVAAGMLALARLPFTEKTAHALAALATAARTIAEDVTLADQLAELERAFPPSSRPPLAIWRDDRPM